MAHSTAVTEQEYKPKFKFTKDIPYLIPMGMLLGVNYEDIWENLMHHNGTELYYYTQKPSYFNQHIEAETKWPPFSRR